MKVRGIGLVVLVLCVLGGLISALFTPSIAATLTLPAPSGARQATKPGLSQPTVPANTAAVAPATQPATGVTVLAQDTFQRPDQALWGISSDHRTWGGDANTKPAFAIVNHAGQITGGQGALQATLNVTNADAELLVSGMVSQFDAQGNSNLGVVLRWKDANNWYKALIDSSKLQLLKDVSGHIAVLAEHSFRPSGGTNYSIRFRVLGSDLFAKAWPSAQPEPTNWMLMAIDTQLVSGMSGVRVKLVPGVIIRINSFLETSVPPAM